MKKLILSALMLISGFCQATDRTNQYAYGAMIETSNDSSMYSRIELTSDVYTQTLSSHLDDIRVFNHKGQPVPYALVNVYQQDDINQIFPVNIYDLDKKQGHRQEKQSKLGVEQYNININNKDVQIYLDNTNSQEQYYATYLLQVPNEIKLEQAISRLSIDFDTAESQNWQATAKLLYSQDLSNWQTALNNVPMMSLIDNNNEQSLKVNTIDIPSNTNYKAKYWILQLKSEQQIIPTIKKVEFISRKATPKIALYPINFELASSDQQEAIYQLPTPQPVKELSISLQNSRTVLPISVYYKSNDKDQIWHKLDDYIIRRVTDTDQSQSIKMNNSDLQIKQLKIKANNASFDQAPQVVAYRSRMSLIFNSGNNGPFILAWGSAKAKSAALSEKALLSDSLSAQDLPAAYIGENIKLAGKKALSQTVNDSNTTSSYLPKWLIWICLVIGAIVLMIIALKLLNEVKNS
ncbi:MULTISPECIES: DUF3999 family protein [unclassified Gilliamella]|uniref:DUF3999 family protein n=1 Tax=unclassified Gilliamella TaxID=2685620 RepID=UPI001309631B|nr:MULTISPECIES: DUF3999 family protein [unclassified Gilliamella]MWP49229.1 DUF3999 family protein [Gilliamella sp. Lep-s35]MWP67923.1 DUF3999 family protein [Gilliamella sp. Lep-s5]MWP76143.1 DUF3999 family protein [Gilliamella sp. Lep-s21]